MKKIITVRTLCVLSAALVMACATHAPTPAPAQDAAQRGIKQGMNVKPPWLGTVSMQSYDGISDDLLTAGLGKAGLGGAAPAVTNAQDTAQLRRLAIWTNYRAILDISAAGGYGTLYGPNVRADGTVSSDEGNAVGNDVGKIAGTEYLAYADDGTGQENVTMLVQLPANFNPARACIVTGASSGSRGVYGAIGSSGEWGLKHGCAVAYTDKGTGTGVHDLSNHTVNTLTGLRTDANAAAHNSNFTAPLSVQALQQLNAATPNRMAVKHAHSQQNPEKNWGRDVLRSIEFAFFVLNERYGTTAANGQKQRSITSQNTTVIAAGVSNGAGAALAAAEQDTHHLIDGVAVSEPQVQIRHQSRVAIQRGNNAPYTGGSKPLLDYFTYANLYQPCAALSTRAAGSHLAFPAAIVALATARCQSLAERGLLKGSSTAQQADDALDKLLAYGWEADTIPLQVSHWRFATPGIAMTYGNTYGRYSVADHLCGLSFAFTEASSSLPTAPNATALSTVFGAGNGVPPTVGVNIVNNLSVGGAKLDTLSVSPSNNRADLSLDAALCQRQLITGKDANAQRVQGGIAQVLQRADLKNKPALIVHGRADTLIPVNFSSRAYYAANKAAHGNSKLHYVEVTNAQHFDAFLGFPGYANTLVPLHVYFNRALDAMYAHLTQGTALPPSQVVHTVPRGGAAAAANSAPPIAASHVPPWSSAPDASKLITLQGGVLLIPE
jgi:hydroxybutyrate-dimer hydrolase